MDINEIKVFYPQEVRDYLKGKTTDKNEKFRFRREGFRCLGSGERGMGGLSRTAKYIPESIHILLSPVSCMRHCDFDLMLNGYKEGYYSLCLTEQEIVGGKVVDVLWAKIEELLKGRSPKPKVIMITATCADSLIRSDYTALKKWLKSEHNIRFGVVTMYPILAENKVKHTDLFVERIYSLIETDINKDKKKLINLLGRIEDIDISTDFYKVLEKAGYEVRDLRQCKTLEQYDEMGEACLNVVLSEFNLYAAKMMEKKYRIPYFFWNEHMDPDSIRKNYEVLEDILSCKLDIEELYQKAKDKVEELQRVLDGKTFAVGQRLDYWPLKAACDLIRIGTDVRYIFVDDIKKRELSYYEWLAEHSPSTKIYLAPDVNMRKFIRNPEPVDVMIGNSALFLKNMDGFKSLELSEEPYDFETFIQVADQMIRQLTPSEDEGKSGQAQSSKESPFARKWMRYPKGVV